MRILGLLTCGVLSMLLMAGRAAAGEVENPQFAAWSRFGIGSTVVFEGKMDVQGQPTTFTSTRTLKEKASDHVVVELDNGKGAIKLPRQFFSKTIAAKVDADQAKQLGTEKITAAGKSYECTIYRMDDVDVNLVSDDKPKLWISGDVPGGVVKIDDSTADDSVIWVLKKVDIKK